MSENEFLKALDTLHAEVPEEVWAKVPTDLSRRVDEYLYGSSDQPCPQCGGEGHIDDPLNSAGGGRWFRYCECASGIAARKEDRAERDAKQQPAT